MKLNEIFYYQIILILWSNFFFKVVHGINFDKMDSVCLVSNPDLQNMTNLIAQRLLLADKVAVSKWDSKTPIEDLPREKIILNSMVQLALTLGLNDIWAKSFFTDQIEANKLIQFELHKNWEKCGHRPDDLLPVNLTQEVRPEIDRINTGLVHLAKSTLADRKNRNCCRLLRRHYRNVVQFYKMDFIHRRAFRRALKHIMVE